MEDDEVIPCPATDGRRVCCYAEGHEERSGFHHRFVMPDEDLDGIFLPTRDELEAMLPEPDAFDRFQMDLLNGDVAGDDVEERMRRAWRETNRIDNGEDDE